MSNYRDTIIMHTGFTYIYPPIDMRILVNARFLLPNKLEGIGLYTLEVMKRIVIRYPEHHYIFCVDRQSSAKLVPDAPNVSIAIIKPQARHPILFLWWFEVGIPQAFRKYQADVFFSPDGFTSLSNLVSKTVLVIHDLAYLHFPDHIGAAMLHYYRRYMPRFIRKADKIITVSHQTKKDLKSHFPGSESKTTVIYNGVRKFARADSYQSNLPQPYFVCLGSLHPRKNILKLLEAFTVLRRRSNMPISLVLIGRKAWKTSQIEKKVAEHPFKDDIIFTGYLSDAEVSNVMQASAALVYVSLFEGFGLPIVEAMSLGVPVITSDRSSMREVAGDAALLVDPTSEISIAEGMLELANSPDKRISLSQKGRARAMDFDWDDAVKQIVEVLTSV